MMIDPNERERERERDWPTDYCLKDYLQRDKELFIAGAFH